MSDENYSKAFRDKIFPAIHKKVNGAYISSIHLRELKLEFAKLSKLYRLKKSEAFKKVGELSEKYKMVTKKKEDESAGMISVTEQTKKQVDKIKVRNDELKKHHDEMARMTKSLEKKLETLRQRKAQYILHIQAYKPCKDMITEVAKLWPTTLTEFELLKRLETLSRQKMRFLREYKEINQLRASERKKLLYEHAEMGMIILSNKLDELEQERKDINAAIEKEEEKFYRMMDTSSEVESAFGEVRLGCLRLYHLTQPHVKTLDPFEQLTSVLEFGQHLQSVLEALEKPSKT